MSSITKEYPVDTFIGAYVRWARRQTDAPEIFHVGCALAALSSIFAPRVARYPVGAEKEKQPLHLWIGLVGESGRSRKSTCQELVCSVLPDGPLVWSDDDRKSPERSWKFFSKHNEGILVEFNDWSAAMAPLRRKSWLGGRGLLLGLQDGGSVSHIAGSRSKQGYELTRIVDPRVTALVACNPALVRSRCDESGSTSRMLWLFGESKRCDPFPIRDGRDENSKERLFNWLARLRRDSFSASNVGIDSDAIRVLFEWIDAQQFQTKQSLARLGDLLLRATALDVLGSGGQRIYVADVERTIRVLGDAAVRGLVAASGA